MGDEVEKPRIKERDLIWFKNLFTRDAYSLIILASVFRQQFRRPDEENSVHISTAQDERSLRMPENPGHGNGSSILITG
jgi:hypothetical protein